jgi:lysophospholipase L1-like esterase
MRKTLKNASKLIGTNLLVLFFLVNVVYWSIPTVGTISELYDSLRQDRTSSAVSPSYAAADAAWLPVYSREYRRIQSVYQSFVGWRTNAFAGETINVQGPYLQRRTVNAAAPGAKTAYFFGGSTMWGAGSNDAGTIPSQFASITGFHTENFGNNAWVAHQSLVLLMQLIQEGHRPDLVVFYDGINEVYSKCLRGHTHVSHAMETRINTVLHQNLRPASFAAFLAPVGEVLNRLRAGLMLALRVDTDSGRDCDTNPKKSELIAESLIRDWQLARRLVESYGGKFVAFLQPVLMFSRTPRDHLTGSSFRSELRAVQPHYEAVYPLLRQKVARSGEFHDLVEIFDGDQAVYIDIFHVSPRGNRRVAEKIKDTAVSLGWIP